MLTVDDANTIMEKYGKVGFWYKIDLTPLLNGVDGLDCDFVKIRNKGANGYHITICNSLFYGLHYFTVNGELHSQKLFKEESYPYTYSFTLDWATNPDTLWLYLTANNAGELDSGFQALQHLILPVSSLQIPVINGVFDDKFYIDVKGQYIVNYTIDGDTVELETDEKGTFLTLPSADDCVIGVTGSGSVNYPLYKVTFRTFKSLPSLHLFPLYKGTPQHLQLVEDDTSTVVYDFQAYYQGRKLKDNIIELPHDAPDIVDVVVDVNDRRYPPARVKLKVKTSIYSCNNKSKVVTAINNGIKSIKINGASSSTTINEVTFNDMYIDFDRGTFKDCTFNNCIIHFSGTLLNCHDGGGNVFNNCRIYSESVKRFTIDAEGTVYNNCDVDYILFYGASRLVFTGTLNNCMFRNILILSDGDVEITDSDFAGSYGKDYFPNFLYLTGEYTVKGNSFTLTGEWTEPLFNMCIIKTVDGFNPSQFINDNSFDLNITYDDEPTDTFYYNIVDDDKIYARRLS